ncbi:MAG TPA: rhomboid family intramembrane serine protease [Candidatus Baltobacteraceae bacterium]|nr:rhomboid family intramembrane serine protease [Candidatus Baltobacteraceae bacterium]
MGSGWYQIAHRNYLGAAADVALLAGLGYLIFTAIRDGDTADIVPQERVTYDVGDMSKRRPWVTYVLIGLCAAATLAAWASDHQILQKLGSAGYTPIAVNHEWWRLITAMFLHVNVMHIYMNMTVLFWLGTELETILGRWRFLLLYILCGIGGNAGVVVMHQESTVGASTALYGLMGASLYFAYAARRNGFKNYASRLLVASATSLGINLLITFGIPAISAAGHIGGLLTGIAIAAILGIPSAMKQAWRLNENATAGHYTCGWDGHVVYEGPARYAVDLGFVQLSDTANAQANSGLRDLPVEWCDLDNVYFRCIVPQQMVEALLAGSTSESSSVIVPA